MFFKKTEKEKIREQLLDQEILKGDECMKSIEFPRDEFLILITTDINGEQHPVRIQSGRDGNPFTPFFENSEEGRSDAMNIAAELIKNIPEGVESLELCLYKLESQVEKFILNEEINGGVVD